jgi:hypothetical protein
MKRLFTIRNVLIVLAVAVAVTAGLLIYAIHHPRAGAPTSSLPAANINCMQSSEYFVVDDNPGSPGLNIVAKRKTSADEVFPCTNVVAASDIVVQNDLPEFVLGLSGHVLIVDSGTAPPPRGLVIYDLNAQTSTYTDTYSPPISIASGTIAYWESTRQAVTKANCPALGQYSADGLGAVIASHVVLDLSSLTVNILGEYRCEPVQ